MTAGGLTKRTVLLLAMVTMSSAVGCAESRVLAESEVTACARQAGDSEGYQRQYAPDRKVDILHITIDVTPNFKARTIRGTTTIKFAPIAKPLEELRLDAIDLDVSSVTSEAAISGYTVTDNAIVVTFDPAILPESETTLTITYKAEPQAGLYFRTPELGYREQDMHICTQGETHEAPHWFPSYDYPNERSTSEVICRVPPEIVVVSNGRLISEDVDPDTGLKASRWLQDKPHVNYLIALVAGRLKKIEARYRDIPLAFYTPTSHIEQAHNSFKDTVDMMAFYEKEIGVPYPWDKYDQAVCEDFGGGMENTTLTILGHGTLFTEESENIRSSQGLVAHELVHQWFGDYVTCKDWTHLWLNEGFATYYEKLYDGHKNGRDAMLYNLYRTARRILSDRDFKKPIVYRHYSQPGEQFDYRAYSKGGWVLHMLRNELGEDLYRKCIKTFLERHALGCVVTEDLNSVIEELSGRSFDRFFDQWVYKAGHPKLTVRYNWSQKDKLAKISLEQTHQINDNVMLFHFRTKVRFIVDGETIDREIVVDKKKRDFYFALPDEPSIVRFDPAYSLLAEVKFDKPAAMLYAQLENKEDVIGRLLAVKALEKKKDKRSIAALKESLNSDPFWGVRNEASAALGEIHTDEAFEALKESTKQSDARVRQRVVIDIGDFYRTESLECIEQILKTEKNPEIIGSALHSLGRYNHEDVRKLIAKYLKSTSYRNVVADGAIHAIRTMDDPLFIPALKRTIRDREDDFSSWRFSSALQTLARIARDEEDKTEIRNFLADYVNHPKRSIQVGAINALGALGDPKAIPIIETFVGDEPHDRVERAADEALKKLRQKKQLVPEEVNQLREAVDDLKKDNKELHTELQAIKDRLEAQAKTKEPDEPDSEDKDEPDDQEKDSAHKQKSG